MNVKRIEDLREVANETLAGLEAGPALRHRIQSAADPRKRRLPVRALAVALSCALLLAVALPIALRGPETDGRPDGAAPQMTVMTAGEPAAHVQTGSLRNSQLTIMNRNRDNAYGLWDSGTLIRVNGRCYRLLKDVVLDGGDLDAPMAVIETRADDLTLTDAGVAAQGVPEASTVYGVRGISQSALVACELDGQYRVFQRVSYAGNGRIGSEELADVMPGADRVTALALTGCDPVEGDAARELYSAFLRSATPAGNGPVTPVQVLQIALDNGVIIQLSVNEDRFGGCGTWSCAELVEALTR